MTTILLSIFAAFGLIFAGYATYRRQQIKNSHKQTRVVLREHRDADQERTAKILEDVQKSVEWDAWKYESEEWR